MYWLSKIFALPRWLKRSIQIFVDVLLVFILFPLSMWLRIDELNFISHFQYLPLVTIVCAVTIIAFYQLKLYRTVIRYISTDAYTFLLLGSAISAASLYVIAQILDFWIPRSVPIIYFILLFFGVSFTRFIIARLYTKHVEVSREPVAIYGAGNAGHQFFLALKRDTNFRPVMFIDENSNYLNLNIGNLKVYNIESGLERIHAQKIRTVLIAAPELTLHERNSLIHKLVDQGVDIKIIPRMDDILQGVTNFVDLRSVHLNDLLGRRPVEPDIVLMKKHIYQKIVMVTGAGGSIGSEICRQVVFLQPEKIILYDLSEYALYTIQNELNDMLERSELDIDIYPILGSIQNKGRLETVLKRFNVETIYHAAAYKHVNIVEKNVVEGIRNNVFGTKILVEAAIKAKVKQFTLISSDKAVRPTNIMGATKRLAELICQAHAQGKNETNFAIVRFGNVLGSSGSVIPKFQKQIKNGGPVTVTHKDINRFFMTVQEAAQLVIQAGAMSQGGDVFVLDMGEPIKIFELAKKMIKLHGFEPVLLEKEDMVEILQNQIPIKIIGLNPGEKLFEELLLGKNPVNTEHPRIMRAEESFLPLMELNHLLDRLFRAAQEFDIEDIIAVILECPTDYQPDNIIADIVWQQESHNDNNGKGEA